MMMLRWMLKSKIHRARVTDANLDYMGSITIDEDLLEAADIMVHERVQVVNLMNGARMETYAIGGPRGRGGVCLNGAAARLAQVGDVVIIMSYALMDEDEISRHRPRVVHVDTDNSPIEAAGAKSDDR